MSRRFGILALLALGLAARPAPAAQFFVSPDGSDAQPGSAAEPFATLERARDAVRQLRAAGPLPPGGVTVEIAGGAYWLKQPLELTAQDSGTADAPIIYRARQRETVRVVGGRAVTPWQPVQDPAVLERLSPRRGTRCGRPISVRWGSPTLAGWAAASASRAGRDWNCSTTISP